MLSHKEQASIVLLAEIGRSLSTQETCAGLYALAIGAAATEGAEYWRPINQALEAKFGRDGRQSIKVIAWDIQNNGAAALKAHADA